MKCTFCMLMPTQRPCLPPPCPGSKMLAGSTILFNRSLMTYFSNWYMLFNKTTGRWSDVLYVPPPLWSCKMVAFIVARCRLVSSVKISFTHIFLIWNSSSVIIFVSSPGHLSGPVLFPGFKHIATYFTISWVVNSPLKRPGWCSAAQCQSVISPSKAECLSRPYDTWSS